MLPSIDETEETAPSGAGQKRRDRRISKPQATAAWDATFLREVGRPATAAAVVGGIRFDRGVPQRVDAATRRKLLRATHLKFNITPVK